MKVVFPCGPTIVINKTSRRAGLLLGDDRHPADAAVRDAGEVRAEVRERLRTVGEGGGLILGPTHNVQLDTPVENLWAMIEAVRRC